MTAYRAAKLQRRQNCFLCYSFTIFSLHRSLTLLYNDTNPILQRNSQFFVYWREGTLLSDHFQIGLCPAEEGDLDSHPSLSNPPGMETRGERRLAWPEFSRDPSAGSDERVKKGGTPFLATLSIEAS